MNLFLQVVLARTVTINPTAKMFECTAFRSDLLCQQHGVAVTAFQLVVGGALTVLTL